jgi:exopolyphosphatase/guanosine-5'-triphosphate,3'-diphosphate pyrophosphatase
LRLASIDIGTNSALLSVADAKSGRLSPVLERCTITRLGRGTASSGMICAEGLDETLCAARSYLDDCRRLGAERIRATGTSAMRDARNGSEVISAFASAGIEVEIISGDREASLTYLSAHRDFGGPKKRLAVIDVGGGSTEIIAGEGEGIAWRKSFQIGAVRARESCFSRADPPLHSEHAKVAGWAAREFDGVPSRPGVQAVAVAGTPTTLAAVSMGLKEYSGRKVHGRVLTAGEIRGLLWTVGSMKHKPRTNVYGLEPGRADVIDAGAIILLAAMSALGVDRITVSDGGVRWGLLWEMAGAEVTSPRGSS